MKRPSGVLEAALSPLSRLYREVIQARNDAYDRGYFKSFQTEVPVMSIGNLTVGGTGKTPLTAMLVEEFRNRGKKIGIVSRGYGGIEKGPVRVSTEGDAESARRFGDEPSWLAARFPSLPVFVGADRVSAVNALLKEASVDFVISDDGFQHRRLRRAMDVVVLDATEPLWHYRPLPLGRMREPFASLGRAQVAVLTKFNLAPQANRDYLQRKCEEYRVRSFELESVIPELFALSTAERKPASEFSSTKLFLASAIGRPQTFEALISSETKAKIVGHQIFKDHHAYSATDLIGLDEQAKALGADFIVVTEKDAVKMTGWQPQVPVFVSRLETRMKTDDLKEFYEIASRNLF